MMVNNVNHSNARPQGNMNSQHHSHHGHHHGGGGGGGVPHHRPNPNGQPGHGHHNNGPHRSGPGNPNLPQRPRQPPPPNAQGGGVNQRMPNAQHPGQNRPAQPGQNLNRAPNSQNAAGGPGGQGGGANQPPAPPPPPPVLPKGWKREEIVRTKGISAGLTDVVYVPSANSELSQGVVGRKFRSKLELQRHFGNKFDVSLLDYRRGKASQVAWRKQRRLKSILANPSNFQAASKYDYYLNLPARQTVSVFKQPVVTLTDQKNDPTPSHILNGPNTKSDKPMPTQLFWELRFKGMRPVDASLLNLDGLSHDLESTKLSKFENFDLSNEEAFMSIAASWYVSQNKILLGQGKDFEKNSRIFIDREQPLIPAITVKEEEIKAQESRIAELRKEIKEALQEFDDLDMLEDIDAPAALTNGRLAAAAAAAIKKDEAESPVEEKVKAEPIKVEESIEVDA